MTNRLAEHLTTWKAWYAVLGFLGFLLASIPAGVGAVLAGDDPTVMSLLVPVQFIVMAVLALALIALAARRWPTARDLALKAHLGRRELVLLAIVFVVTHVSFWALSFLEDSSGNDAARYFDEMALAGPLLPAVAVMFSTVILAPVCEELLYRGAILRPIHDAIARRGSTVLAATISIAVSTVVFALPHLAEITGPRAVAYLITGAAFGLVYVITGSMTAAMVSHSLQSCLAMAQVLLFGRGDHPVSPILYVLVFTCPIVVYLIARGLHRVFPKG